MLGFPFAGIANFKEQGFLRGANIGNSTARLQG